MRPNFRLSGPRLALTMTQGGISCVAGEIGKILRASLTELRCTAIEAG